MEEPDPDPEAEELMNLMSRRDSSWCVKVYRARNRLSELVPRQFPRPSPAEIAKAIDHTFLALDATQDQIDNHCAEAKEHGFGAVCVRANWVPRAVENLRGTGIGVASVVAFPEGTYSIAELAAEARYAMDHGATELDMVINYPFLKNQRYSDTFQTLMMIRTTSKHRDPPVGMKMIIETSQLSRDDIIAACVLGCAARVDYMKTSTGFRGAGATVENVTLMRSAVDLLCSDGTTSVKASGGIRTADDCIRMMRAGATRIGTSAGVSIVKQANGNGVLPHDDTPNGSTMSTSGY